MPKIIGKLALALGTLVAAPAFAVPVTFEAVCLNPSDCDSDTDFSLTFTLDDSVITAGGTYETSSDGGAGLLGWTLSSSVGDGFSASGDLSNVSGAAPGLTFGFDSNSLLTGVSETGNLTDPFFLVGAAGEGVFRLDNFPTGQTFVTARRDNSPTAVSDPTNILLSFQEVTPVPLPASMPLLAGGAGLMAFVTRRRRRRAA